MHTCSERCTRINVNDHLVAVLRLYFFPGWDYKNVVYIELMEVLLPVVDPVYIFRLRFLNGTLPNIKKCTHIFQFFSHVHKNRRHIFFLIQIKCQICCPVIIWNIRQNIHEHLLLILFCKRNLILNLHTFNSKICQHTAHNILRLCRCF